METAVKNQRCGRKRARDDEEAAADNAEILQPKKQEYCSNINTSSSSSYNADDDERGSYQFHDGIGVFDFPWLKDGEGGVIFDSEPSTFEDDFTPVCDETHRFCDGNDHASSQNLCVISPAGGVDGNHDDDDESLWSSLAVDNLEAVDCIWSCVIDHPLNVGFSKG